VASVAVYLPKTYLKKTAEGSEMLGWLILFAVFAILSGIRMAAGHAGDPSVKIASVLFSILFVIGLLTRAARGRAW
jgi:uncharacterized membrane protein YtjA (UPF0391 family)